MENFEFTDYEESADRLDYWLDEREYTLLDMKTVD